MRFTIDGFQLRLNFMHDQVDLLFLFFDVLIWSLEFKHVLIKLKKLLIVWSKTYPVREKKEKRNSEVVHQHNPYRSIKYPVELFALVSLTQQTIHYKYGENSQFIQCFVEKFNW